METKIQELTDKIFREGVERGNAEAERIMSEARDAAKKLLDDAKAEAAEIVAKANADSQEIQDNAKNELNLYAAQAVNALKSEITTLITDKIVSADVNDFIKNKDFLNSFIVSLAKQWTSSEDIVISASDAEALKTYFAAQAKDLLNKGVTIEPLTGKKCLFSISPADGSYKVNFGAEEFESYLKDFLRPQLVELLFK